MIQRTRNEKRTLILAVRRAPLTIEKAVWVELGGEEVEPSLQTRFQEDESLVSWKLCMRTSLDNSIKTVSNKTKRSGC